MTFVTASNLDRLKKKGLLRAFETNKAYYEAKVLQCFRTANNRLPDDLANEKYSMEVAISIFTDFLKYDPEWNERLRAISGFETKSALGEISDIFCQYVIENVQSKYYEC